MAVAALILIAAAPMTLANANAQCLDPTVRNLAAQLVEAWSFSYPFARVIIGDQGHFGEILSPRAVETGQDTVVCEGTYQLVKIGKAGNAYRVRIDSFKYRWSENTTGYRVQLEDLPATLDGTNLSSSDLIARFSIDGRPYSDVLNENKRRIDRAKTNR